MMAENENENESPIHYLDISGNAEAMDINSPVTRLTTELTQMLAEVTLGFIRMNHSANSTNDLLDSVKNAMLGYHLSTMAMLADKISDKNRFIDHCESSFHKSLKMMREMLEAQ